MAGDEIGELEMARDKFGEKSWNQTNCSYFKWTN